MKFVNVLLTIKKPIMTKLKTGIYTHIKNGHVNVYTAKQYKNLSFIKKLLIKFNL